ncbi:hypothetical protein FA15DRAFT_630689 [Coprinopsis marcescibilis]|uniref:Peptide N-acetyl-beta-D-glucosaminyl asparaginase amidase A N-terminal domain-containing protein n=1 Tax=Coprinopsis marcescibilis TaxID=230819 RepID=A0A5C3LMI8_COPMA|nr:hypothetical protein FA15DRAFT_630689 [Coprinopsis marcescibilis]
MKCSLTVYSSPEIVQFTPPKDCGPIGSWATITLNFTSSINGTQYDRLGIFTFQNVEIWRMTTSQPLRGDGVVWSYVKDVSRYTPLFAKPGKFILQLDNVIQTGLDGIFSTTVDATFYASSPLYPPAKQADLIIPLSTLKENEGNHASVPPGFSINVTLPRNSVQVYAELHASGNAAEEFWYINAANEYIGKLPSGIVDGQGPFREIRLLVDGRVAGVAFPYATIFTGGFVPAAWKPIPAYPAHDLPTYFIDLTPFLPVLVDGKAHSFTIEVISGEEDRRILENWYVSGILQVFTHSSERPTRGRIIDYMVDQYPTTSTTGSVDAGGHVDIRVSATRNLLISSEVIDGSGRTNRVSWSQKLNFKNEQRFEIVSDTETVIVVKQSATGLTSSLHNGRSVLLDTFDYPLELNFTISGPGAIYRKLEVDHAYKRDLLPLPIVTRTMIINHQLANGLYTISPTGNFGNGSNSNVLSFLDDEGNTYRRRVNSVFNNITLDEITGNLAGNHDFNTPFTAGQEVPHQEEHLTDASRLPGRRTKV